MKLFVNDVERAAAGTIRRAGLLCARAFAPSLLLTITPSLTGSLLLPTRGARKG